MYNFYIQQVGRDGTTGPIKNLEQDFRNLRYRSFEGLETVGAPKNIYTEEYPEVDGPRVFHPSDIGEAVTHKQTTVKLCIVFVGTDEEAHRQSYHEFTDFVSQGRFYYWDTARHKKALLMLNAEVAPEKDTIKGTRFIMVTYTLVNLWGCTKECDDSGNIIERP